MKNILKIAALFLFITSCNLNKTNTQKDLSKIDTLSTESGVLYYYLKKGDGPNVESHAKVSTYLSLMVNDKVIWTTDKEKDSIFSWVTNNDEVIDGFDEVTLKLREGDEIVAILPPHLAYGEKGSGEQIPPNSTLVYDQFKIKKVYPPRSLLKDTLFNALDKHGKVKMYEKYQSIMNSADTSKYHYGLSQMQKVWAKLNEEEKHQDALEVVSYFAKSNKNNIWLRYFSVLSLDKLGKTQQAIDSLEVMILEAPSFKELSKKLGELTLKLTEQ